MGLILLFRCKGSCVGLSVGGVSKIGVKRSLRVVPLVEVVRAQAVAGLPPRGEVGVMSWAVVIKGR